MTTNSEAATVAMLLTQATPDAAARLRDMAETTEAKETRKAARRALYLLSQRGILPPETTLPPTNTAPIAKPKLALTAWASAYDGAGNRLLFLTWPSPDGGSPTFLQTLLNDEEGVRDMESHRIARRELDERLHGFLSQLEGGIALAEIAPDYGRFLLYQARNLSQQQRRRTPAGFLDMLSLLGEPEQEYPVAPIWERITPEEIEEIRADSESISAADLFKLPWFEAWFLDVNDVVPWLSDVYEVIGNPDASEEAKKQGVQTVARNAVEELFNANVKARYLHRLEETADVLYRRGREIEARQALRHALALRDTVPAVDSEFAIALVQRTMQAAIEMMRQRSE